jgi:hypothetical protein
VEAIEVRGDVLLVVNELGAGQAYGTGHWYDF